MNITGQAPQLQPNVVQTTPQQSQAVQNQIKQQAQADDTSNEVSANTNFQKLAEEVLAKRSSGESIQKPLVDRGQVLDLLV